MPDPWSHIRTLARPSVPAAPSQILVAALAADSRGAVALTAIRSWARSGGGLPLSEIGAVNSHPPKWWPPSPFAKSALSAVSNSEECAAVAYLGRRLVEEGRGLLDMLGGMSLLQLVKTHSESHHLQYHHQSLPGLVRLAATEACIARDQYLSKSTTLSTRYLDSLRQVVDFWAEALRFANSKESSSDTLARMQAAINGSDAATLVCLFDSYKIELAKVDAATLY